MRISSPGVEKASLQFLKYNRAEQRLNYMRLFLLLVLTAGLGTLFASPGEEGPLLFYVQIIRGANDEKPAGADWKAVGPTLKKALSAVFRWKHYWEVKRFELSVRKGKPAKVRLNPDRELEIHMLTDSQAELRLFFHGKATRKMRLSVRCPMSIMGGDMTGKQGWFVVVRRDKPTAK
jgi:hypothetical protein